MQSAEEILSNFIRPIYGFALAKTANIQDAEDLAQEIMLRLYKAFTRSEIENPNAFIWRCAHNTLVNYYRGRLRSGMGISEDIVDPAINELCEGLIEREDMNRLHRAIANLSKLQRMWK